MKPFFTRTWSVSNNGIPTPYTHVQLGTVDIILKNGKVIGVDTPRESYSTETLQDDITMFGYDDGKWSAQSKSRHQVSEDAVTFHLNRLLMEQAERYINNELRRKILEKDR